MGMSAREKKKKQRALLFVRQEGKCHWCSCDMVLMYTADPKFHPKNLCTVDHLDDRYSPERGAHQGEFRRVAACGECNFKRAQKSESEVPIEELHRRSNRPPSSTGSEHRISTSGVEGSSPSADANI